MTNDKVWKFVIILVWLMAVIDTTSSVLICESTSVEAGPGKLNISCWTTVNLNVFSLEVCRAKSGICEDVIVYHQRETELVSQFKGQVSLPVDKESGNFSLELSPELAQQGGTYHFYAGNFSFAVNITVGLREGNTTRQMSQKSQIRTRWFPLVLLLVVLVLVLLAASWSWASWKCKPSIRAWFRGQKADQQPVDGDVPEEVPLRDLRHNVPADNNV